MKKKLSLMLALALALSLAACSGQTNSTGNTMPEVNTPDTPPAGFSAVRGPSDTSEPAGDNSATAGDGSGFPRTISTIAGLQPNANVLTDGLSIFRNSVSSAAQEAMDWASEILS